MVTDTAVLVWWCHLVSLIWNMNIWTDFCMIGPKMKKSTYCTCKAHIPSDICHKGQEQPATVRRRGVNIIRLTKVKLIQQNHHLVLGGSTAKKPSIIYVYTLSLSVTFHQWCGRGGVSGFEPGNVKNPLMMFSRLSTRPQHGRSTLSFTLKVYFLLLWQMTNQIVQFEFGVEWGFLAFPWFSLQLHRGEGVRKQQSLSETQRIGGGVTVHKATTRWCKTSFSDRFMAVPQHRVISFSMKLAGMLTPSCPLSVPVQSSTYLQLIKHQLTHKVSDLRVSVTLLNIHQFTWSKTSFQRENVNISMAALELDAKTQNVINTLS